MSEHSGFESAGRFEFFALLKYFQRFEIVGPWHVQVLGDLVTYVPKRVQTVLVGVLVFEMALNAIALTLQFFFRYQLICRWVKFSMKLEARNGLKLEL